eukprot:scaffold20098_cov104-Isochrysis_galbana.AAC.5
MLLVGLGVGRANNSAHLCYSLIRITTICAATRTHTLDAIYTTQIETLLTSGDSAGHPVPDDPSALTPLPHYLPIPFPYSGRFSGGMVQKLRALQQPEVGS